MIKIIIAAAETISSKRFHMVLGMVLAMAVGSMVLDIQDVYSKVLDKDHSKDHCCSSSLLKQKLLSTKPKLM
ncbi:putative uncharacterized protein [Parachlamydia acanthamoebae UV-7]|jgi:hypothetical protein|uniref:Uncharacterized protein n=2 Tax=Parachlamydia acanthamoebae TaxID=83552 RepID=F8KYL0_PARAV|nr:hypothetical protein pah_c050o161 [Parachlamydia acanthamoebae str. Hall's coccus]KIA78262.1 hypothetical protein DB43_EI00070 [Parachlamydia acanthamoebae]CCB85965.1 putative uncharacterized protein [Parachlamydia acanthamoebae UV-7]